MHTRAPPDASYAQQVNVYPPTARILYGGNPDWILSRIRIVGRSTYLSCLVTTTHQTSCGWWQHLQIIKAIVWISICLEWRTTGSAGGVEIRRAYGMRRDGCPWPATGLQYYEPEVKWSQSAREFDERTLVWHKGAGPGGGSQDHDRYGVPIPIEWILWNPASYGHAWITSRGLAC